MKAFLICSLLVLAANAAKDASTNGKKRSVEHSLYGAPLIGSYGGVISPAISYSSGNALFSGVTAGGSYATPIVYGFGGNALLSGASTGFTGYSAPAVVNQDTHEIRHVTQQVPVAVPQPYPVTVTKTVSVPQPYAVSVPKPYAVPVEVKVPVHIPKPYAVKVPHPVAVPVAVRVPVEVPKPYAVYHTKTVKVDVEKPVYVKVPYKVKVPVPQPYNVEVRTPVYYNVPKPIIVKEPRITHTYSTVGAGNAGFYAQAYAPNFYPGFYTPSLGPTYSVSSDCATGQLVGGIGSVGSGITDFGSVAGISEFPSAGGFPGVSGIGIGDFGGEAVTIGSGGFPSVTPPTGGVVSDESDSVTVEGRIAAGAGDATTQSTFVESSTTVSATPTTETQTVQEQTLPDVEVTSPGNVAK